MKMTVEIDPIEEKDYAQLIANISEVTYGLFDVRYNFKKRFEWAIEANKYESQYDLLDAIMEEFRDLFPNIDVE